jgi:seryl-tRNA(Sec) selenium transferase
MSSSLIMSNIYSDNTQSANGADLVSLELKKELVAVLKSKMQVYKTPEIEEWRVPLLRMLLAKRKELLTCEQDTSSINDLIESLCTS